MEYISKEAVLELVEPDARPFLAERICNIPTVDIEEKLKEWLKVNGYCPTCARCSDNREHTTTCPIEEHYALPLDGHCHLYEEKK